MDKKKAKPPAPPRRPSRPAPKPRNEFGDPADTLYAGGTPLLDERTGRSISKREHQRGRRPPPKKK